MPNPIANFADCQQWLAPYAGDIFALGNSVYHGLGLLEILPATKLICLDDDNLLPLLARERATVFSLAARGARSGYAFRSSANLLAAPAVREFLKKNSAKPWLYVPKVTSRTEIQARSVGARLVGAPSRLNQEFEDKVSFTAKLAEWGLATAAREDIEVSGETLRAAVQRWGWPLVIQFSRGIAGEGTKFLADEAELKEFASRHQGRRAVAAKYLAGPTITLNACVTRFGPVIGRPFWQITGEPLLNRNQGGTGGNDYAVDLGCSPRQMAEIFRQASLIGNKMKAVGFRGIFGLDFVVGETVQVIEINARPTASIPTVTQLERLAGEVPLLGLHLLEFLGVPYELDLARLNKIKADSAFQASKVILRNTADRPIVIGHDWAPGVYEWLEDRLVFRRPGWRIPDIGQTGECLVWTAKAGRQINVNIEEAIIYFRRSVLDPKRRLDAETQKIIKFLRSEIETDVA